MKKNMSLPGEENEVKRGLLFFFIKEVTERLYADRSFFTSHDKINTENTNNKKHKVWLIPLR